MVNLGDVLANTTIRFPFTLTDGSGGRTSLSASLEEADIVVFKDGSAMTLDASTITITEEPGSRTGLIQVAIDLSNDADFTTGSDYYAILYPSDETVDSQAPIAFLAFWSIENRTVNADRIDGSADAAVTLKDQLDGLVEFTVSGTPTGTVVRGTSGLSDNVVNGQALWCFSGTGAKQVRQIVDYDSGTGDFTVDPAFTVTLSTDSRCQVIPIPPATTGASYVPEVALIDAAISANKYNQTDAFPNEDADGSWLTEAGGNGDHLTEAGGNGDHLTEAGGNGDHLTEAGGTGDHLTGISTATAADIRDAILDRVLSGNHDTTDTVGKILQDIIADTDELQSDDIPGSIAGLNDLSVTDILDASSAVDGLTPRQLFSILLAAAAGELSGADSTSITITDPAGNNTRISATVDANGNRSAITLSYTGIT